MNTRRFILSVIFCGSVLGVVFNLAAQERLPRDNGLAVYHTAPRYSESESHPVRILGYMVHPFGWVLREGIFRPLSYWMGANEVRKSVFGFREPFDFREPECFSPDGSVPDCRSLPPYNYGAEDTIDEGVVAAAPVERHVYFPDVNFDFDARKLNALGRGRSRQIADLLNKEPGLHVVLEGHTDHLGSEDYNNKLGLDRSDTVRQELVSLGVSGERVSTVTFGKSKPIYADESDWARAVNRRVEVQLGPQ